MGWDEMGCAIFREVESERVVWVGSFCVGAVWVLAVWYGIFQSCMLPYRIAMSSLQCVRDAAVPHV